MALVKEQPKADCLESWVDELVREEKGEKAR